MSMYVDLSIQSTELASPNNYITISDITVTGLIDPIQMTIPLYSPLNTTIPNNTLDCGYLDTSDDIFKDDGLTLYPITDLLVTCQCTHLTAIGVQ
jgi:hypothetical protein